MPAIAVGLWYFQFWSVAKADEGEMEKLAFGCFLLTFRATQNRHLGLWKKFTLLGQQEACFLRFYGFILIHCCFDNGIHWSVIASVNFIQTTILRLGNDAELNVINKFKSSCFDLLCLGFWDRTQKSFRTLPHDVGKSHEIFVVFNGEVKTRLKRVTTNLHNARSKEWSSFWLSDVIILTNA